MQKKNIKKSLSEAIAQSSGKGVIDMTGKSDHDMNGIGSHIPDPVFGGVPVTQAHQSVPGIPATMAHAASGTTPTSIHTGHSHEEEDHGEHGEHGEHDEEETEETNENFRNALGSLLGEDVSPSLITQLEAIFEAAVSDRVEKKLANILVELDESVNTNLNTITETLVEKVDDYLDYVVEEWMQENSLSVEQGIKTQIAENFISGLKNLFENHYIDVPAEKYNVLDELYAQNRNLEEKLNNTINENINLKKEVSLTECAGIFVAETRDLADTQVVKLQNLMESVQFASPEQYREKLVTIKENYLKGTRPAPTRVVDAVDTFSKPVNVAPTTLVEGYANVLGRLNKKV
jgi:hypothetical protein